MILSFPIEKAFESHARIEKMHFLDAVPADDANTFDVYMRDEDAWVYVHRITINDANEISDFSEVLAYDAASAANAIPPAIISEASRLENWNAKMALDPATDPDYHRPY